MHSDFEGIKTIEVNGIYPDDKTIQNWQYPYTSEFYALIRSDLSKSSMAFKLYELMQTRAGKRVISESGYVPN
jgi:phosphate transport system substrate-binding protein